LTIPNSGGNLSGACRLRLPTCWEQSPQDVLARLLFFFLIICGVVIFLLVLLMLGREAYPLMFEDSGLWRLLIADPWEPLSRPARFGVRHAWISTLTVTSVALAVAAPVGFGIGVFIAEIAPAAIKRLLQPCLESLAGIPSVSTVFSAM
jgi:phosphate transport system permease protein